MVDFKQEWTQFALDAEVDAMGTSRIAKAHNGLRQVASEAFGVLTEPGMMDVDEWKAWSKRVCQQLSDAIGVKC